MASRSKARERVFRSVDEAVAEYLPNAAEYLDAQTNSRRRKVSGEIASEIAARVLARLDRRTGKSR